jgi:hypothetical protein
MLGMVLEEFVTTNILYFYMKRTCLFYATCNAFIYEDLMMHTRFADSQCLMHFFITAERSNGLRHNTAWVL